MGAETMTMTFHLLIVLAQNLVLSVIILRMVFVHSKKGVGLSPFWEQRG